MGHDQFGPQARRFPEHRKVQIQGAQHRMYFPFPAAGQEAYVIVILRQKRGHGFKKTIQNQSCFCHWDTSCHRAIS